MKTIYFILFILALGSSFIVVFNDGLLHHDSYMEMESINYSKFRNNISVKCGVYGSDLLWTTAMEKISNCIDNGGKLK